MRNLITLLLLFLIGISATTTKGQSEPFLTKQQRSAVTRSANSDRVQAVLYQIAIAEPHLVDLSSKTGRWYLKSARPSGVPEEWLPLLQEAFYADVADYCKQYEKKYLASWKALASKAARETFWGTSFLSNSTYNYFGIRRKNKAWACESFQYCEGFMKHDPDWTEFVVFPNFEASLWMFIHTIFSDHFLERLPDEGKKVEDAIYFERLFGVHYWEYTAEGYLYAYGLDDPPYSARELIQTWSGYTKNNLCVQCDVDTDLNWINKIERAGYRYTSR